MSTLLQRKLQIAVLLLAGGCGSADSLLDAEPCAAGLLRRGETPCGLNGNGLLLQECQGGVWQDTSSCVDDPDGCRDADKRPGTTPCGLNGLGFLEQECQGGVWQDTAVCDDPDDCLDTDLRDGIIPCGLNDRGFFLEECDGGRWVQTLACNDPDECHDTDTQTGATSCGLNGRGKLTEECVEGQWQDTDTCEDPDECLIGSSFVGPPCGPMNNGNFSETCPDGTWVIGDLCDDALSVHLVRDIYPNASGSFVPGLTSSSTKLVAGQNAAVLGDRLLFTANDGVTGAELWITDGTEGGTSLVADLATGTDPDTGAPRGSNPAFYAPLGSAVYFSSFLVNPASMVFDSRIYVTDGTPAGTTVVCNLDPTASALLPIWLTPYQAGIVFFTLNPVINQLTLWRLEPGAGDPVAVKQFTVSSSSTTQLVTAPASPFVAMGGRLYFTLSDGSNASLWATDGTPAGTVVVKSHAISSPGVQFQMLLSAIGDTLWYSAPGGNNWSPWISDGTAGGTTLLKQLSSSPTIPSYFFGFQELGASTYFLGEDGASFGLWSSGGTADSTQMVTIISGLQAGFLMLSEPLVVGDRLFFGAATDSSSLAMKLWTSDGTTSGTHLLLPDGPTLNGVATASVFTAELPSMSEVNGLLVFVASKPAGSSVGEGVWLWRSDGTEAGTWPFVQLSTNPAQLTSITRFLPVGNRVYFNYDDGTHGTEPWVIELATP